MEESIISTNDQGLLESSQGGTTADLSHLIVWQVSNS